MKSKTLILMAVAIVCGLAASYMTSRVIAERGTKNAEQEKVAVLVARQNLGMGTLITDPEKVFEEKPFIKGEEPKKAVRSFDDLKGRRLNKPVTAEQFVTADDLIDKDKDGLASLMKKGMRAVGLNMNAERMVGGFVLPHSHVDIVSVVLGANGETYAKIILQNILVLAVDQSAQRPDDKQAVVASTVTVQVTPEQAERLALAMQLGTLRLILRSFGDEEKVATVGITPKGILQGSDGKTDDGLASNDSDGQRPRTPSWSRLPELPPGTAAPVTEPKPVEAPPKVHTMTIYNGLSVTRAVFTLGDKEGDYNTRIEKSQPDPETAPKTAPQPAAPQKP